MKPITASFELLRRIRGVSAEFGVIVAGKVLVILINVLGIKWITHLVDPEVFGRFTLLISYVFIIELLFGVLAQGLARYYFISKEKKEYFTLKKVFFYFVRIIGIIAAAICVVIGIYSGSLVIGMLLFLFAMISGVSNIISLVQNSERHRIIVVIHELFDKILKFGLSGISLLTFGSQEIVILSAYLLAVFLIFSSQYFFYKRKILVVFQQNRISDPTDIFIKYRTDILVYSLPFLIWTLFYYIQINSDKWLIDGFFSAKEVGLYQVINQYGFQLINMATSMLTLFMIPILFKKAGNINETGSIIESVNTNNKVSMLLFGLFVLFIPVTFLIHRILFSFLVSDEFDTYSYLFPYMVFAGGCFALAQILSNNYLISFNTKKLILPKIIVSLSGIIINYFFIKYYGLTGLVIGVVLVNLGYLIWMFLGSLSIKNHLLINLK